MKLHVLFFSVLRDLTGHDEIVIECEDVHTVGELLTLLFARWPRLAEWDASLLVAVDQDYVKRDAALRNGAEVAIMPPVQGG
jgi:molybdopterin converting factor subunit 1